jgi:hypothetical protein
MPGPTRVPRKNDLFDQYIRNTTSYLLSGTSPVNWQRLGLSQSEMDKWEDYKNKWVDIFPKYTNKGVRTSAITQTKNELKKTFIDYVRPLLTRISSSPNINETDRATLHLRKPDRTLTKRGMIHDVPVAALESHPGGRIKVRCQMEHDSNRASMHKLADAIEMKIKIGDPAPGSPDDCPMNWFSTTAIFNYQVGQVNAGKRIYVFCRYVNLTNPAHNGSFNTSRNVIIQG